MKDRLQALVAELASSRDHEVRRAVADVAAVALRNRWAGADQQAGLRTLGSAVERLDARNALTWKQMDLLLSVLRDAAQRRVVAGHAPAGWAADLADAEHAVLVGEYARSAQLLLGVALHRVS